MRPSTSVTEPCCQMPRRRSKERRWAADPEEVIRGEVALDVRVLLRLIQDVNPTSRQRDSDETRRRYALKAGLQSVLLRQFADEIEVAATGRPGVVGLRHRTLREDGGHALVALLDEDVRARLAGAAAPR